MSEPRLVHIVDDDEAVRESATFLLRSAGYRVATHPSGKAFLAEMGALERGCILLDIHMPGISGLEVQEALNQRGHSWPVIVLTGQGDVGIAVQAMKNGAFEFLEKPYQNAVMLSTIERAFEKLEAEDKEASQTAHARALIDSLSARERQVMQGLLAGLPNKLIAHELSLSTRTVDVYRANIMGKLQVRALPMAVRIALTAGLAPLSASRRG